MPVSKNKRKTRKRIKLLKKAKRRTNKRVPLMHETYRSFYVGIGASFSIIALMLLFFGEGTDKETGISVFLLIVGVINLLLGKFAKVKTLRRVKRDVLDSDSSFDL